jgi:hypothetical protein
MISTKCSSPLRSRPRISRNAFIVPVLTYGATSAADPPVRGSTAAYR